MLERQDVYAPITFNLFSTKMVEHVVTPRTVFLSHWNMRKMRRMRKREKVSIQMKSMKGNMSIKIITLNGKRSMQIIALKG